MGPTREPPSYPGFHEFDPSHPRPRRLHWRQLILFSFRDYHVVKTIATFRNPKRHTYSVLGWGRQVFRHTCRMSISSRWTGSTPTPLVECASRLQTRMSRPLESISRTILHSERRRCGLAAEVRFEASAAPDRLPGGLSSLAYSCLIFPLLFARHRWRCASCHHVFRSRPTANA